MPRHRTTAHRQAPPLQGLVPSAAQHLRLALFGVIARVIEGCADGDVDAALAQHPFLADYAEVLGASVPEPGTRARAASGPMSSGWAMAVRQWTNDAQRRGVRLPLAAFEAALSQAGLGPLEIELLLAVGLVEEDPRFGAVFADAQGDERRPTFGLLMAWWRHADDGVDRIEHVRHGLLELIRLGLLEVRHGDGPRPEWALAVPHALWDALRGDAPRLGWAVHLPLAEAAPAGYIPPRARAVDVEALTMALQGRPRSLVLVRGPRHNGRKTLLRGVSHALGRAMLVADATVLDDAVRWRLFGVMSALLDAMPVLECDGAPGQTRNVPPLPFVDGPLALVTSRHGGWSSDDGRPVLAIEVPAPALAARRAHWQAAVPEQPAHVLLPLARAARLGSGHIRTAAAAAAAFAALERRSAIGPGDLQQACRGLPSARLETLATRLPPPDDPRGLCVDDPTRDELDALVTRCRLREELAADGDDPASGACGVRALFTGGSGTGKTLAARLLAHALGKDLHRIDLAATVNKYLGETEKSLNNAFAAAEELDVVLLLDEGDALMARRTDVGSSNDRYANLETNFLLQRIESFDGILVVTSNAADRIDKAFSRRMDVVIPFRPPDEWQRYRILERQLGRGAVDDALLQEVAARCALTGGQIGNVVRHARLLAIETGRPLGPDQLHSALAREYRKIGGHCPLRATHGAGAW